MHILFYLSESQLERIKSFFPVLTVFPVSMTGASSAASLTPSGTGLSGRMPLKNRVRARHCTIGPSGGVISDFSVG